LMHRCSPILAPVIAFRVKLLKDKAWSQGSSRLNRCAAKLTHHLP
jgi:hypothetical protein